MAGDFDGSTGYYETSSAVLTALPITFSAWHWVPNSLTADSILISQTDASAGNKSCSIRNRNVAGGSFAEYFMRNTAFDSAQTANTWDADRWNHVCGFSSNATTHVCVLNGDWANRGTASTSGALDGTFDRTSIGRASDLTPSDYTDGLIGECAIWNVALSQSEIEALAGGIPALQIRPASLQFYLPVFGAASTYKDWIGGLTMTKAGTVNASDEQPPIIRDALVAG